MFTYDTQEFMITVKTLGKIKYQNLFDEQFRRGSIFSLLTLYT